MHVVPGGQEFPAHGSDEPEIKNTITFYFYFEKILIFSIKLKNVHISVLDIFLLHFQIRSNKMLSISN
jgi:hypothetical protein